MASSPTDTPLRPPPGLPREARLESLSEIRRAHDEVIALAQRHIKVFDRDLSSDGWNSPERCSALSSYLRRKPGARLDIIVHETRYVEAYAARLTALLGRHAHAMKIYRTGPRARPAMDPLVIVDDMHFVHRHHVAWAHATLSIGNPERAKPLVERFDEIWATGEAGVSASVLGL
ncbi:MAG TPA: hypothetical protein VL654_10985 [Casimicrobiaceae bacterium]|jgi:hypothetical protein|nr:hypothetical protein [Casimicrobiaceae bacterium]